MQMMCQNRTNRKKSILVAHGIGISLTLISSCSTIPHHNFEEDIYTQNIEYEEEKSWYAIKDIPSNIPLGLKDMTANNHLLLRFLHGSGGLADVFFIHPSTYFETLSWNQDPMDLDGISRISGIYEVLWKAFQASVFSECCEIFAPRYRQSTYGAFGDNDNGLLARELAFYDISSAFDYYMDNYHDGRPIIISGHSQGSELAMRLIYEKFNDVEMAGKLLVAYIPGFPFPEGYISSMINHVPICSSRTQISCINTWMTLGDDSDTIIYHNRIASSKLMHKLDDWILISGKGLVCVNPLSWRQDGILVESLYNPGSYIPNVPIFMSFPIWGETTTEIIEGFASAQCKDGFLVTDAPRNRLVVSDSDYHRYDIPLFYLSIKENVLERIDAYYGADVGDD